MESFFHSLNAELTHQRSFINDHELHASDRHYIDRLYNTKRIHSSLGYHSTVEFGRLPMPSEVSTKTDEDQGELQLPPVNRCRSRVSNLTMSDRSPPGGGCPSTTAPKITRSPSNGYVRTSRSRVRTSTPPAPAACSLHPWMLAQPQMLQ